MKLCSLKLWLVYRYLNLFLYIILPTGCFISGLEYSASTTAEVVGKPQKSFFLSALAKLNQLYGKTLKPEGKLLILNFTFFYKKKMCNLFYVPYYLFSCYVVYNFFHKLHYVSIFKFYNWNVHTYNWIWLHSA